LLKLYGKVLLCNYMQQPHTKNNKKIEINIKIEVEFCGHKEMTKHRNGPYGNENVVHVVLSYVAKFQTRAQTLHISTFPISYESVDGKTPLCTHCTLVITRMPQDFN